MPPFTIHVLGYCRSTVGGYDVWVPGAAAPRLSLRGQPATSINRMNYQAVLDCLLHVADVALGGTADVLELRIGCYTVAGQLDGSIPARKPHVRALLARIQEARRRLGQQEVRFVYDRDATPPRGTSWG